MNWLCHVSARYIKFFLCLIILRGPIHVHVGMLSKGRTLNLYYSNSCTIAYIRSTNIESWILGTKQGQLNVTQYCNLHVLTATLQAELIPVQVAIKSESKIHENIAKHAYAICSYGGSIISIKGMPKVKGNQNLSERN